MFGIEQEAQIDGAPTNTDEAALDNIPIDAAILDGILQPPDLTDQCFLCRSADFAVQQPEETYLGINCGIAEVLGRIGAIDTMRPQICLPVVGCISGPSPCQIAQAAVSSGACGGCARITKEPCAACDDMEDEDFLLNPDEPVLEFDGEPILEKFTCGVLDDFLKAVNINSFLCDGIQGVLEEFTTCECVEAPSAAPSSSPSSAPSSAPSISSAPSEMPTMSMGKKGGGKKGGMSLADMDSSPMDGGKKSETTGRFSRFNNLP